MSRKRRGRHEGSIFQRGDGTWGGSLSLGYDGSGKRKRRVVYGGTKKEVQEELQRLQTDASTGMIADAGRLTVGAFIQRWLEHTAKSKVRPTTYARYEQLARLHVQPILA